MDKQQVLYNAPYALNRPNQPWVATVEGDAIIARWKWMDASFFSPHEVSNETRNYSFTAILGDNGKWKEIDNVQQKSASVGTSGGKLKIGGSTSSFKGNTNQKSI